MNHSFSRFGIDHLSASSLNLWRSAPGLWALRYIARLKDGGSPGMWRGTAVENGLAVILHGRTLTNALTAAHQSFDQNAQNYVGDDLNEERDLIAPMLEQCLKWTAPSSLNATQLRIEHFFDPIPIPLVGWLDFAFEGADIDLKTTKACPSSPRSEHVRQVALYRAARKKKPGGLLYVTNKRHAYYPVTDEMMEDALAELHADALTLNNFLARCDTKEDALKSLPIDYSHYQAPKTKVPLSEILLAG